VRRRRKRPALSNCSSAAVVAPDAQPVSDVLANLAAEIARARDIGLRVEGAICAIAVRCPIEPQMIQELQQLDAMLQQLAALGDFAAALSGQRAAGNLATAAALDRITLGDVRMRLAGAHVEDDPSECWEML
jgi:hypothetical protein